MASKKQVTAAIIMKLPGKSSCRIFSLNVASAGLAAVGVLKVKKIMPAARPPMGRLI